jgi:hypothetical protein
MKRHLGAMNETTQTSEISTFKGQSLDGLKTKWQLGSINETAMTSESNTFKDGCLLVNSITIA